VTAARRVKIFGAGSIGNHLAHASRQLGWNVIVCDVDPRGLARMRQEIYPGRYGAWDPEITLCTNAEAPTGGFDLVCIGTPPEHHLPLALQALAEEPRAILVEKPLCPPSLELVDEMIETAERSRAKVFVGYDHVVGKAARLAEQLVRAGTVGRIQTIDVEFREHWQGIFQAHPWLSGPEDSYLGYWSRGGGASGEHSHALNLWQHFAHVVDAGRVAEVSALLSYVRRGRADYDELCLLTLRTTAGLGGRVVQDVITRPPRKRARLQGTEGALEWVNGHGPQGDAVIHLLPDGREEVHLVPKRRPDDFIEELKHIDAQLRAPAGRSPIALERGLDTMFVLAAAHRSEQERCHVAIDYRYDPAATRSSQESS
jgi:predicted dehydrogenase